MLWGFLLEQAIAAQQEVVPIDKNDLGLIFGQNIFVKHLVDENITDNFEVVQVGFLGDHELFDNIYPIGIGTESHC